MIPTSVTLASSIGMISASSDYTAYVLSQINCAAIRARLIVAEIESAEAALRGDFISADEALAWAYEAGVLPLIAPSST